MARSYQNLASPARWLGRMILAGISCFLFLQTWRGKISRLNLLAWCGAVTFLVHPTGMSYEQMTLLIPLFIWAVHERRAILAGLIWAGFILVSWLALAATLSKFDPLAASSWLLLGSVAWLVWLFAHRNDEAGV